MPLVPFARQSKAGARASGYSGERLKNWFLRPSDAVSTGVLIGGSGSESVVDLGAPTRAVIDHNGVLYAVAGGNVWRVVNGVASKAGAVPNVADTRMASSGSEIAIVAAGRYFICDGTNTTECSTGAVDTPKGVAYLDGYFIVIGEGQGRRDTLTVSALDDGKTFNALEFAHAESAPDGLVGVIADHGQVRLFGSKTVEAWYNSGGVDFPLAPNRPAQMQRGCADGLTIAAADNAVFWVGEDRVVYRSSGGSPEVISSREVEEVLRGADITGGFTFTDKGHKFYAVHRVGGTTLTFDITTGLWSERSTGVGEAPWACTSRATVGGVEYLGTRSGYIARLDPDRYDDNGAVIEAEGVSVPIEQGGDPFSVARAFLSIRGGVGGLGRAPQVMLQTSRDGVNWSVEKWRPLGKGGDYAHGARWHSLGQFQRFQVRIRITDAVPRDVYGVRYD